MVLTEFDVYADRHGVVLRRDVAKGDFVNKGAVLFEVADLSNVWIMLDAYESDLPFLRIGQKIAVSVASVPGREFPTTISFIDPSINPQTRTAYVRAQLNNPQQTLKPEMFVKGKIRANLSVKEKSLAIPKTSLLWTGKRSVVYVRAPDSEIPAFEMREITLGASLGEFYIVESGLSEGEEIVTNGVFAVDASAQLSGNYSMMNRAADTPLAVPDKFTDQLTDFVKRYLILTSSLVKSDVQLARTNAKMLESKLSKIDMNLLDEHAHRAWMQHHSALKKQMELLTKADDLEKQREVFDPLSTQLIKAIEAFGIRFETIYVAYCPMALGDKGAYWLSEIKEINNPYFGEEMLRCGEITKTIRTKGAHASKENQHQGHQH
jgi:Cu(I)/Ag(I) efflux system membrane fusion protein